MSVVEDERRRTVRALGLLEDLAPDIFGAAEDLGDELPHFVRRGPFGCFARVALSADLFGHIDHGTGVETEEVGDERNDDSADAQPAPNSHPPSILDVATGPLVA